MDDKKTDDAKKYLKSVVDNSKDSSLKTLASIRLASIFISEQEKNKNDLSGAKEAISILNKLDSSGPFALSIENSFGDAYFILNEYDKSKAAYNKALSFASDDKMQKNLIKLKLNNIPFNEGVKS